MSDARLNKRCTVDRHLNRWFVPLRMIPSWIASFKIPYIDPSFRKIPGIRTMQNEDSQSYTYDRVGLLSNIPWSDYCLPVADRTLPSSILDQLPHPILVKPGEGLKALASIGRLAEEVLARRASRPLILVAVGGGSVGDAVAFLASILWRGVGLWHIPTNLIAMVDSVHGGKTAVNLGEAKNQLGSFYAAQRVFIVDELLSSLPSPLQKEGMAELLKALWLGDVRLFEHISPDDIERLAFSPMSEVQEQLSQLLEKAVDIKLQIVRQDPYERSGIRTVLNLGHTLAHALELTVGLRHGLAVAWGMVASLEFSREFGMDKETFDLLRRQIHPLLHPLPFLPEEHLLLSALARDKKQEGNALRSVLLQDVARPLITESISPREWLFALGKSRSWFKAETVRISLREPRPVCIEIEASKSELNRALLLGAVRPGRTKVVGRSIADDVLNLLSCLRSMGIHIQDTADGYLIDHSKQSTGEDRQHEAHMLHCGEGGTTLRFLLAFSALGRNEPRLYADPVLLERPQEPLIKALERAGATVRPFSDAHGDGLSLRGWDKTPESFEVDTSDSSQFASALSMITAGLDRPCTLRLLGNMVSESYLRMTLDMLEKAGVDVIRNDNLIAFNPTSRLRENVTFTIARDESSAAVWQVAKYLGHPLVLKGDSDPLQPDSDSLQPDSRIGELLERISAGNSDETALRIDVSDTPDLLPVLAVAALHAGRTVSFTGAAHIRGKESDRLDDFAATLSALGVAVETDEDSLLITPANSKLKSNVLFETHNDHRRVMAGLLLSMLTGELPIDSICSIRKSYPAFWDDARRAGWHMELE